jgi:hypothetical protein
VEKKYKGAPSIPVYAVITYFFKKDLDNYFGQQNIRSMPQKLYRRIHIQKSFLMV